MAKIYKTPGVYVTENPTTPPPVVQVETAIPAFIGYTQHHEVNGVSCLNTPVRIQSIKEYEEVFGFPDPATITLTRVAAKRKSVLHRGIRIAPIRFRMYYSLQLYFANGGGPCYIVSVGKYADGNETTDRYQQMKGGLEAIGKESEPTILLFPDACRLPEAKFYEIYKDALAQCGALMNRMVIIDLYPVSGTTQLDNTVISKFREGIGLVHLKYGAAYYPYLCTTLRPYIDEATQAISGGRLAPGSVLRAADSADEATRLKSVYHTRPALYAQIWEAIKKQTLVLPPGSAIAGVYCTIDATRGVWKAPANVGLGCVTRPVVPISSSEQDILNDHSSGKSVNAIRAFTGKGTIVWGARTLAGNDNEWRYIPVRRFFIMVEQSLKKALAPFVFEPNDANTWVKVRGMVENFLTLQWRAGALQGVKPEQAFYVSVGLGQTMTALDILEGRMIVEVGMAVVRPAEFIILRFSHNMIPQ